MVSQVQVSSIPLPLASSRASSISPRTCPLVVAPPAAPLPHAATPLTACQHPWLCPASPPHLASPPSSTSPIPLSRIRDPPPPLYIHLRRDTPPLSPCRSPPPRPRPLGFSATRPRVTPLIFNYRH
jgi:hypothetical protein